MSPLDFDPPLLSVEVEGFRESLCLKRNTQELWLVSIDASGRTAASLRGRICHSQSDGRRVLGGWLPGGARSVELTTADGGSYSAQTSGEVWLGVAPLGAADHRPVLWAGRRSCGYRATRGMVGAPDRSPRSIAWAATETRCGSRC